MLDGIRSNKSLQLVLGLLFGLCFGFLLQKGAVTRYEVILGQLLLVDWTVVKVMMSAVVTGMLGVHVMYHFGLVRLHKKPGSVGATVIGGLIFGVGFAVLGYCPGTDMGAVGQGNIDALVGGVAGMIAGAATFAVIYPRIKDNILRMGDFGKVSIADLAHGPRWAVVLVVAALIVGFLALLEAVGL